MPKLGWMSGDYRHCTYEETEKLTSQLAWMMGEGQMGKVVWALVPLNGRARGHVLRWPGNGGIAPSM